MTPVLPFRLKLPGTDLFSGLNAISTSFRVHGTLRLAGDLLLIEWSGVVRTQEVGPLTIRDEKEVLSEESLTVPVSQLDSATVVGGWWLPRLALYARERGALGAVPSEKDDAVLFWYARRDRPIAIALAAAINDAIEPGDSFIT